MTHDDSLITELRQVRRYRPAVKLRRILVVLDERNQLPRTPDEATEEGRNGRVALTRTPTDLHVDRYIH